MNRNRFAGVAVKLGAATLALFLATVGLALAGVNLPDPAQQAFERVGISLPNQAGGGQAGEDAKSDEVKAVIDAIAPSDRGCEFGQRVPEAAKGSPPPEKARGACTHDKSTAAAARTAGPAKANGGSSGAGRQFGQDTSESAGGLGDASVEQRRQFGKDTAERAKQLGGGPAPDRSHGRPSGAPAAAPVPDHPSGPPASKPSELPTGTPSEPPTGTSSGHP